MKNNRGKDLAKNTAIIGIGKFSTQIVSFLLLPLYTSILTTTEYGIYDLIITISVFLLPFITLLMEESMFRFLIDCKDDIERKKVISQSIIYIVKSTIAFLLMGSFISIFFKIPYSLIAIIYIFTCILSAIRNALTRGLGKIKLFTLLNFIASVINITLNVLTIAVFRMGIYGLLISGIISNLVTFIALCIKENIAKYVSLKNQDKRLTKKMIKYSIPLVPNSLSWAIVNLSDRIVISGFLGSSSNGIYSMSYKFPTMMDTIYGFFYTAWKESSAKAVKDDDKNEFFNHIYIILSNLLFAVSIGIIVCMPLVFNILIKENFREAYLYIPILVIAMYYNNMSGYYGGIFTGYKNTKIMGYTTVIGAIINILVDIALIKYIGIYAAAISTLISCMVIYYYRKIKVKEYVKLNSNFKYFGVLLLAVTMLAYYLNTNIVLKIINFIIVLLYCIFTNKEAINFMKNILLKTKKSSNEK